MADEPKPDPSPAPPAPATAATVEVVWNNPLWKPYRTGSYLVYDIATGKEKRKRRSISGAPGVSRRTRTRHRAATSSMPRDWSRY